MLLQVSTALRCTDRPATCEVLPCIIKQPAAASHVNFITIKHVPIKVGSDIQILNNKTYTSTYYVPPEVALPVSHAIHRLLQLACRATTHARIMVATRLFDGAYLLRRQSQVAVNGAGIACNAEPVGKGFYRREGPAPAAIALVPDRSHRRAFCTPLSTRVESIRDGAVVLRAKIVIACSNVVVRGWCQREGTACSAHTEPESGRCLVQRLAAREYRRTARNPTASRFSISSCN